MNKKKSALCAGRSRQSKNGTRKGLQLYKCLVCQHQFRSGFSVAGNGNMECLSKRQTDHLPNSGTKTT